MMLELSSSEFAHATSEKKDCMWRKRTPNSKRSKIWSRKQNWISFYTRYCQSGKGGVRYHAQN